MLCFQATKFLIITFFILTAFSSVILNTQSTSQQAQSYFQTQFFQSQVRLIPNTSQLIYEGLISQVQQFRNKVLSNTYQSQSIQYKIPAQHQIDQYTPDVQIKITYKDQNQQKLNIIILVAKSFLQQTNSIVDILQLQQSHFDIDLNKVKGIKQQFQGFLYHQEKQYTIIKPEVLLISQIEYNSLKLYLKNIEHTNNETINPHLKWITVKNKMN